MVFHCWHFALLVVADASSVETPEMLKARLLDNYGSKSTRPFLKHNQDGASCGSNADPEVVDIQVYVDQFRALDMQTQTFGIDGYLRLWWQDPALAFNDTESGGCADRLSFGPEDRARIWKPTLYWEGAKDITLPESDGSGAFGELLYVYPDGRVWWSRQTRFLLKCPVAKSIKRMPFDSQACSFLAGPYAEDASMLYLRWKPNQSALVNWDGACLTDYAITNMTQESILQDYSTSQWTYAKADVIFTRVPVTMMTSYFIPALLLVFISYLGFYIDPTATPGRVALGMLCMVWSQPRETPIPLSALLETRTLASADVTARHFYPPPLSQVVVMTNMVALSRALPPSPTPSWIIRFITVSFYFNVLVPISEPWLLP